MLEVPACTPSKFGNDGITIPNQVDVEVDVIDGLMELLAARKQSVSGNLHRGK